MPQDDEPIPPILLPATNSTERRWLARLRKAGKIRRVGPRLYASVPRAKLADAIRIIPTVYRDEYLLALRALTRRHRPTPLVNMLVAAQRFSHLEFSPYPTILKELQRRNWFREPGEARIIS